MPGLSAWVLVVFMSANQNYNSAHAGSVAIDMPSEIACRTAFARMVEDGSKGRPNMWGYCMKRSPNQ
jgi:hypothetical protein